MARVIRRRYLGGAAVTLGGVLAAACGEVEVRYVQGPAGPAGPGWCRRVSAGLRWRRRRQGCGRGRRSDHRGREGEAGRRREGRREGGRRRAAGRRRESRGEGCFAPTAGPKRILFDTDWGPDGPRGEVVKRSLALYKEKHPEITVDVRFSAGREQAKSGTVFARTAVLIAADDMGDLFLWAAYVFVYWAKRGLFADLTPYFKQFQVTLDDYVSIPQHEVYPYPNGKIFGWPFQVITRDWMYNKSILDRHGIEPNENWTFDDLIEAAKQVQEPDNNIYGCPLPVGGLTS